MSKASRPVTLVVSDWMEDRSIWTVYVNAGGKLKENQEGWTAWWLAGRANVVSVVPEEHIVFLQFVSGLPPSPGEMLQLYPPRFLEELCELWKRPSLADEALTATNSTEPVVPQEPLSTAQFKWLRTRQRQAFQLASCRSGYLWGPPGTGKTTTLGALLASYLLQFRHKRVLVISNTNAAVDQSIVSIDHSVKKLIEQKPEATSLRGEYLRMGVHFIPKNFLGKEHLLPTIDPTILMELAVLDDDRPSSSNPAAFTLWKTKLSEVRKKIPRNLSNSRLVAITVAEAILKYDELRASGRFDLLVFDEASQIGRAQALALSTLARNIIYAGDPQQLSPIVMCQDNPQVTKWLGSSMFESMDEESRSTCFLDEQSRMSEPICRVVSKVFYQGKLVMAGDCATKAWRTARSLPFVEGYGESNLLMPIVDSEAKWSHIYGGLIRHESAVLIASMISRMLTNVDMDESKILVLTPYHSQKLLIKHKINMKGKTPISVRTVHSAQGQECHTVFFDPVSGREGLKHGIESARLINVAISRAQACLVIPLSVGDFENVELKELYEAATGRIVPVAKLIGAPLNEIALLPGFPRAFLNEFVIVTSVHGTKRQGKLVEVASDGSKFTLRAPTGEPPFELFVTRTVMLIAERTRQDNHLLSTSLVPGKAGSVEGVASKLVVSPHATHKNIYVVTPPLPSSSKKALGT